MNVRASRLACESVQRAAPSDHVVQSKPSVPSWLLSPSTGNDSFPGNDSFQAVVHNPTCFLPHCIRKQYVHIHVLSSCCFGLAGSTCGPSIPASAGDTTLPESVLLLFFLLDFNLCFFLADFLSLWECFSLFICFFFLLRSTEDPEE